MTQAGQRVFNGRYELVRRIARGGMAEVYLARDQLLDRPVALKVLFPELSTDRAFVARFRREAQAAANLSHPNIVSIYDWGEEGDTYFIVMEYIDGRPLSTLIRSEGSLLPDRAATIGSAVANALAFAHRNGVIHRDVKPGNVLIDSAGNVKVTDFGIARAVNAEDNLTQTGTVMGTATYFSPEQAQGSGVDARSDVYSLGVVLYEMVTGAPPFAGENPVSIAYRHVSEAPLPLRQRNPQVPAKFEAIVMHALAKDPNDRYGSAEELRADLIRFRQGRSISAPPVDSAAAAAAGTTAAGRRRANATMDTGAMDATAVQARATRTGAATRVQPTLPTEDERPPRTGAYVALLFGLLGVLAVLLFLLGRSIGVFGEGSSTKVDVPQVVGLDANEATTRLEQAGLKAERSFESNDAEVNVVFDQDPDGGTRADKGAAVTLRISKGQELIGVPSVLGQDVDSARDELEAAGFTVTTAEAESDQPAGRVTAQDPRPGVRHPKGAAVALTVSTGKATATVPNVVGRPEDDAKDTLINAGFKVKTQREASEDVAEGRVISTDPAPGAKTDKGATVTVVVSSGAESAEVPSVIGKSELEAKSILSDAGFKVAVVDTNTADPTENDRVQDQNPNAGTTATKGSTVTITVARFA